MYKSVNRLKSNCSYTEADVVVHVEDSVKQGICDEVVVWHFITIFSFHSTL